jgi:hypothetical protein
MEIEFATVASEKRGTRATNVCDEDCATTENFEGKNESETYQPLCDDKVDFLHA